MHDTLTGLPQRLAALPAYPAPAGAWARILAARDRRAAPPAQGRPALSLAAAAAVAAVGLAWLASGPPAPQERPAFVEAPAAQPLDAIRAENERLEQLLQSLPERNTMRGHTAYTVALLEDRLSLVDERLTLARLEPDAAGQADGLWRERVDLMNSLVQVRYADVTGY